MAEAVGADGCWGWTELEYLKLIKGGGEKGWMVELIQVKTFPRSLATHYPQDPKVGYMGRVSLPVLFRVIDRATINLGGHNPCLKSGPATHPQ